jgi:hypothetical protein
MAGKSVDSLSALPPGSRHEVPLHKFVVFPKQALLCADVRIAVDLARDGLVQLPGEALLRAPFIR